MINHNSKSQLEQELQFPQLLIEQTTSPAFYIGAEGQFLFVNDAICLLLEYSREELLSMSLYDINPGMSANTWLRQWKTLQNQGFVHLKSQYQTKKGKILPLEIVIIYLKDQQQEAGYALTRELIAENLGNRINERSFPFHSIVDRLYREIYQLKKTETDLATTLSLLQGTIDSAVCGIIAVSFEGEVLSYNQKFVEMWQIPEGLTLSKYSQECRNFFNNKLKNPEVFCQSVWEISRESESEDYDILELKDGRIFVQHSKPQQLGDKIIGRVWSVLDITELKQESSQNRLKGSPEEAEIDPAIEEAREVSELKNRFLSMLCHQFRSWLNIVSFSNSLLRRYVNEWTEDKRLPYLDQIQNAVEQMGKLLDEIVFVGKSEVGNIEFEPSLTDLNSFCRDLLLQMQPMSDSKQQVIESSARGDCSLVCLDQNFLGYILTNLLSNAVKYSPEGSKIDLEFACEDEQVIFQVRDRGIGISAVDQQRLFEPFYRGSNVGDVVGSGLGLAIVKNLVNLHKGSISVTSHIDAGTTFIVTLPVTKVEE